MDIETIEIRQVRQKASVKWLLSKAFNNRVPDNLKQPFYRDHENQEHLKPQIVVGLGNATLYCQTLSNLYSDPNYQSLNHWSIIQMLARKGVPVVESAEMPLTETVLIQTNPLRINAHMSVIESLMILYSKEICSGDRISNAIRRISGSSLQGTGQNYEQFLLSWISHACAALKKRIDQEIENGGTDENGVRLQTPDIPIVRDYQDLCDGVCLALLISYYCPKVVPWNNVRINYLPAVEDSIHNVLLVSNFSQKHLPYSVFHMTPEDITYMRGSMKQNLVVLLADLFNLFEIHPAKCVCYPGMDSHDVDRPNSAANEHGICHRRGLTCQAVTPIPDLRSDRVLPSTSPTNRPPFQVTRSASATVITHRPTQPTLSKEYQNVEHNSSNYAYATTGSTDEGFVVHKSRGITTLSTMHSQEPLVPARLRQAKEKNNTETKADERGDSVPAGRPSNWEQSRRPSFAGRRSRRNSSSEDSQLTIENFGGSQDQLNMIGRGLERDRERERDRDRERKMSSASVEQAVVTRSSLSDARGTLQIGYDTDSGSEKQDRETEKTFMRRQGSVDNVSLRNIIHSKEKDFVDGDMTPHHINSKPSAYVPDEDLTPKRKASISSLPSNTTTWQQQSALLTQNDTNDPFNEENSRPLVDATKLSTILMKLEEKRHHMEQEKRKIELAHSKHQEKVAKAAFLQAINKGKQHNQTDVECKEQPVVEEKFNSIINTDGDKPDRPSTIINQDELESSLESKWDTLSNNSKSTPDMDPNEFDRYQHSIALMNSNLQDIQQDIHRLATKQNQIHAQHMQAQQLLQAQQIANMLNQNQSQPYGSQQHIPGQYQRQAQQSFGSTPHLQQSFNSPNSYNSRPPSRDPYQQQSMQPQQIQYINEHGQYISQSSLPPQPLLVHQPTYVSHINSSHQQTPRQIYSRENSQIYINENGYNNPYVSNQMHGQTQQPKPHQHHHYPTDQNHQYQSHQYTNRPSEYDDYPPPHCGRDPNSSQSSQFYLHDTSTQQPIPQPTTHRRTWAQSAAAQNVLEELHYNQQMTPQPHQQQHNNVHHQNQLVDVNAWQSQNLSPKMIDTQTWRSTPQQNNVPRETGGGVNITNSNGGTNNSGSGGFMLHQNGGNGDLNHLEKSYQNLFPVHSSPQHRQAAPTRQIANNHRDNRQMPTPALIPSDDMAPQSISFIGDDEEIDQIEMNIEVIPRDKSELLLNHSLRSQQLHNDHNRSGQLQQQHCDNDISLGKLNITSGSLTYRIPSPSRPALNAHSFQDPQEDANEKGFYISFDDEQPKRPKPPLRAKRSPKKEKSLDVGVDKREQISQLQRQMSQNDKQDFKLCNNSNFENSKATYNKYNDAPIQLRQLTDNQSVNMNNGSSNMNDRRHLEDVTNQQMQQQQQQYPYSHPQQHQISSQHQLQQTHNFSRQAEPKENKAIIIGNELINLDPDSVDEMERKKEKIMLLSLQRREQQEEAKRRKEIEANQRRAQEQLKEEERARKKEEQAARRAAILEQHKLKKAIEEAEREGKTIDRSDLMMKHHAPQQSSTPRLRQQKMTRPRPKTIHVESGSVDISEASSLSSRSKKGSSTNLTGGYGSHLSSNSMRRDFYRGSQDSLTVKESPDEYPSTSSTPIGRRGSYKNSREPTMERGRTLSRISVAKGSTLNFRGRKSNSLMNLCDTDSGLGRATPPRRAPSPGMGTSGRHMPSPSGPGSLPPGLVSKRRMFDDGSSDISSTPNSMMEYSGPKLYKQPAAKSNRGIILNAVEYCVFPGVVNRDAKQKVLDKIARSEAKHFLVLFRDAGCQFRALYSYYPENESIVKLYGTGPSQVDEVMFDKFFKYNSGGKCFSQVHTKHLTVTIDAFTIHNSLWQGKKVHLPSKKDMALVI